MTKIPISKLLSVLLMAATSTAIAHEGHHHGPHTAEMKLQMASKNLKTIYSDIETDYVKNIKPIFDLKCALCHSTAASSPWYSSIPGIHWIVESDRSEAKEHLEISNGFPFSGHGTPLEDLKALKEVAEKSSMPTALYAFIHPSSRLTESERQKIIRWANASEEQISALNSQESH